MKPCPKCHGAGCYEQRSIENHSAGPKSEVWRDVVCETCGGEGEVAHECEECGESFDPAETFQTMCWTCMADDMTKVR